MTVRLAAFDIDGTLAQSKQKMEPPMASALADLAYKIPVAIISGGSIELLQSQIVEQLPRTTALSRIYLFPTAGAACFVYRDRAWQPRYLELLSETECDHIIETIKTVVNGSYFAPGEAFGPRIEFRGSSVIYSALGQQAPLDKKLAWDPTIAKRKELQSILAPLLPDFAVGIGGSTTIDVTRKGFDKAYAIHWLASELKLDTADIVYVGDALYAGGNDAPVLSTGATVHPVTGPQETLAYIESLVRDIH
jgi:HAD superfamily hydrolase (TIGR01484 family)